MTRIKTMGKVGKESSRKQETDEKGKNSVKDDAVESTFQEPKQK